MIMRFAAARRAPHGGCIVAGQSVSPSCWATRAFFLKRRNTCFALSQLGFVSEMRDGFLGPRRCRSRSVSTRMVFNLPLNGPAISNQPTA